MSYYMQRSYTSTWHRATAPRMWIVNLQPKKVGAGLQGAGMGNSEAPTLQGKSLALGSAVHRCPLCCGPCSSLSPSLPCLPLLESDRHGFECGLHHFLAV